MPPWDLHRLKIEKETERNEHLVLGAQKLE
jgi:hypothetical protein